ncbi:hypothetical protein F4560_001316 [Saccharothrix ecbatanensis]|uniref:Uncharacterized protein n=1 Tax=Saccharothrix ecbatanensis TaxID=1105145 RepID=A0A7W9HGH9_9PSEU|nr:hypothetical protein [Saccharothrix ecbatanensis]MBB5801548.1 hypothetical protein [Saccharothrix ecbatanensis]
MSERISPRRFHEACGLAERDVAAARRISAVVRELGFAADPSAVQTVLLDVATWLERD